MSLFKSTMHILSHFLSHWESSKILIKLSIIRQSSCANIEIKNCQSHLKICFWISLTKMSYKPEIMTIISRIPQQLKDTLKNFPKRFLVSNWNYLNIECKATAEPEEFKLVLKQKILSSYSSETDCDIDCFICNT